MHRAILFQTSGELGNRLVLYSHLLALGWEYRVPITNLSFWRYAHFFEPTLTLSEEPWVDDAKTNGGPGAGERWLRGVLEKRAPQTMRHRFEFDGDLVCEPKALLVRAMSALSSRYFQRSGRRVADALGFVVREEQEFLFSCDLPGVGLMNPALVEKHAPAIRERFRLRQQFRERVSQWIEPLREEFTMLIGVHLRRGDYNRYRGGQWFFDSSVYRRLMLHVAALFAEKRVVFLLASNERLDLAEFPGLEVRQAPGHLALDMYSLAECDLIVGPPSTFSGWASFVGQTPIYPIHDGAALPQRGDLNDCWVPRLY